MPEIRAQSYWVRGQWEVRERLKAPLTALKAFTTGLFQRLEWEVGLNRLFLSKNDELLKKFTFYFVLSLLIRKCHGDTSVPIIFWINIELNVLILRFVFEANTSLNTFYFILRSTMTQETGHTDTDDTEVFWKRFAYTCTYTYVREKVYKMYCIICICISQKTFFTNNRLS